MSSYLLTHKNIQTLVNLQNVTKVSMDRKELRVCYTSNASFGLFVLGSGSVESKNCDMFSWDTTEEAEMHFQAIRSQLGRKRLYWATWILLARNGVPYTSTGLIRTYAVRKVVIECPKLICAVITHPGTPCTRRHRKLNTIVHRLDSNLCIILVKSSDCRGKQS